jgi:hypothetical protein
MAEAVMGVGALRSSSSSTDKPRNGFLAGTGPRRMVGSFQADVLARISPAAGEYARLD